MKSEHTPGKRITLHGDDNVSRIPGTRVTPSQFRARMGDFLARVQYGGETVVISTRGKRVAILCPPQNWREKGAGS